MIAAANNQRLALGTEGVLDFPRNKYNKPVEKHTKIQMWGLIKNPNNLLAAKNNILSNYLHKDKGSM